MSRGVTYLSTSEGVRYFFFCLNHLQYLYSVNIVKWVSIIFYSVTDKRRRKQHTENIHELH